MENVISNEDRIAIAEVDYIIHHMDERYLNKIPSKLINYITILKKKDVEINIDPRIPLEKQGLQEFTLYFIVILNLRYWCNDERRKEILSMMENNQKNFDEKINNIFEQAESNHSENKIESGVITSNEIINIENSSKENEQDVVRKEVLLEKSENNFFKKIIKIIKSIIKNK